MSHVKNPLAQQLGLRIRNVQGALKYTNRKMADEMGVSTYTLAAYKRGETMTSMEFCIKLVEEYHANPEYLLCGDERYGYLLSEEDHIPEEGDVKIQKQIDAFVESGFFLTEEEKMESLKYLFQNLPKMMK